MKRIDRLAAQRAAKRVKAAQPEGEQLAHDLNILLRSIPYSSEAERKAGIERAKAQVGREFWPILLGKTPSDT